MTANSDGDKSPRAQILADIRTPVTPEFLKRYSARSLIIDCPEIILTQLSTSSPRVIRGAGAISLLGNDKLTLRMYPSAGMPSPMEYLDGLVRSVQGEVIPKTEYYSLEARDLSGFLWHHDGILISCHGQDDSSVVTSRFNLLVHRADGLSKDRPPFLSMYFFEDLEIPFNQVVETTTTVEGEITLRSAGLKRALKTGKRFTIQVELEAAEKGSTVLRANSLNEFSSAFPLRIVEALSYVLMKPVQYGLLELAQNGYREVILTAKEDATRSLLSGPVDKARLDLAADFWNLFEAYLNHVADGDDPFKYHPLSAQLYPVIRTTARDLYTAALVTSVAVEGVLNCEFPDIAKQSARKIVALNRAKSCVDRLRRFDPEIADRIKGAIAAMQRTRAKDKLLYLKEKGLITNEMVNTWDTVRNTAAHASISLNEGEIPKLWRRLNAVYSLLNCLVFLAIGYEGNYIDYSTKGWPVKSFVGEVNREN